MCSLSQGLLLNKGKIISNFFLFASLPGTNTTTPTIENKLERHQYDQARYSTSYHRSNLENRSKQHVNPNSRLTLQRQAHYFIDVEGENAVENTNTTKQHNNDRKGNIALTYDKVSIYTYVCLCRVFLSFFFLLLFFSPFFSLLYILD